MSEKLSVVSHIFNVDLAVQYGIDCSILIGHFIFWIEINQRSNKNLIDGRTWMYQTQEEMVEHFPYWTRRQIIRILDTLLEKEIIIKGNFNKISYDRTCWYAFKNEDLFIKARKKISTIVPNGTIDSTKTSNGKHQTVQAIPDTKTDTEKDTTTRDPEVVVFSDLKISEGLKKSLLKKHSVADIELSVKRTKAWSERENDEAALITCLSRLESWTDEEMDVPGSNKDYAHSFLPFSTEFFKMELLNKHIEIVFKDGQIQPFLLKYDEKGFKKKLTEEINKLKEKYENLKNNR